MKRILYLLIMIAFLVAGSALLSGCVDFVRVPESQMQALRDEITVIHQRAWDLENKAQNVRKLRDENEKLEKQVTELKAQIEVLGKKLEK